MDELCQNMHVSGVPLRLNIFRIKKLLQMLSLRIQELGVHQFAQIHKLQFAFITVCISCHDEVLF